MTTLREAAQQALEALQALKERGVWGDFHGVTDALRAALAEPVWVQAPHMYPLQSDRMRIDPVTGDVGIGTPSAEPVQEPVAWRWGYRSITTGEMDWRGYVEIAAHPNLRSPEIIMEPLYTAPTQRKPLTGEEIQELSRQHKFDSRMEKFVRIIEIAHGIKDA